MLNCLCEARIKNHGQVRSARRNSISSPGFSLLPFPCMYSNSCLANCKQAASLKFQVSPLFANYLLGKIQQEVAGWNC